MPVDEKGNPGQPVQVTRHGGWVAFESPDGAYVYYSKSARETSLWKVPVAGGEETEVLDSIYWLNFVPTREGIYFTQPGMAELRLLKFDTGKVVSVAKLEGPLTHGLSISPDRRHALYSRIVATGDLMLVDKFR
jgi:hypothetical protein